MSQLYTREQVEAIIAKERKLITTLVLRIGHKMDSACPGARDGFWPANVVYQCAQAIRKRKSSAWESAVEHNR